MAHASDRFDDNCYELTILRQFRDKYVVSNFPKDIDYYYNIAPKIVDVINKLPNCTEVWIKLFHTLIKPSVRLIEDGKLRGANAPTTASTKVTPPATTVTKPAKVKNVKLKAKKKKLNVSWKKVSGATGYEVKAATNSKFTKGKKTVTVKKNKVTIKNLKPKKKYFVKVRAYKLTNGRKYYGKWSKVVKKKVR